MHAQNRAIKNQFLQFQLLCPITQQLRQQSGVALINRDVVDMDGASFLPAVPGEPHVPHGGSPAFPIGQEVLIVAFYLDELDKTFFAAGNVGEILWGTVIIAVLAWEADIWYGQWD